VIGAATRDDGRIGIVPIETDKQRALDAIKSLPDGATLDDVIERLCFIAKIEEGLQQSHVGRVVPHAEIKKRYQA
jgi:predicted transcriptional regulator